ncbi:hypothetical protein NIES2119_04575 [[Phormidium ambiguum] IAM M-71]|uniref:Uncharacterized protein n=1 Tax=[Phormidium ambiguum] IAM M-71 TaxID=454136 RepID=A0A1U7IS20_9CYAN|nr:hypothetical protein NIES2119_04575 [Phormidium ambiguum IAM M-71]
MLSVFDKPARNKVQVFLSLRGLGKGDKGKGKRGKGKMGKWERGKGKKNFYLLPPCSPAPLLPCPPAPHLPIS